MVYLVVLACVLRATAKKMSSTILREKVHPRENPGYAYVSTLTQTAGQQHFPYPNTSSSSTPQGAPRQYFGWAKQAVKSNLH